MTAHINCQQLEILNEKLKEKIPALINLKQVILHQGNARSHRAYITHEKILELNWEILSHPFYSPDGLPP